MPEVTIEGHKLSTLELDCQPRESGNIQLATPIPNDSRILQCIETGEPTGIKQAPTSPLEASRIARRSIPNAGPIRVESDLRTAMETSIHWLPPLLDSPTSPQTDEAEYGIELNYLTTPMDQRHYSTDHLIPAADSGTSPTPNQIQQSSYQPSKHEERSPLEFGQNYKPLPLRTSYSVLLFVLISGIFAFLEYQVHNLPPINYSVLEPWDHRLIESVTTTIKYIVTSEPSAIDLTTSLIAEQGQIPSGVENDRITIGSTAISAHAMLNARPPEVDYPEPFIPTNTYCGWSAPTWGAGFWTQVSSRCVWGVPPDPGCLGYKIFFLEERIPTFITNDSSWCPCRVLSQYDMYMGDWAITFSGVGLGWDTSDHNCKSVMAAIESFNYLKKTSEMYSYPTHLPQSWTDAAVLDGALDSTMNYYTTAPSESGSFVPSDHAFSDLWDFARTDDNGKVELPLVTRNVVYQSVDVFGNTLQETDRALFHADDHYLFSPNDKTPFLVTESCYLGYYFGTSQSHDVCTKPFDPPLSTTWWILPLSPLASVTPAPGFLAVSSTWTPTSSAPVGVTSTAMAPLTSVIRQPTEICCGTGSTRDRTANKADNLDVWGSSITKAAAAGTPHLSATQRSPAPTSISSAGRMIEEVESSESSDTQHTASSPVLFTATRNVSPAKPSDAIRVFSSSPDGIILSVSSSDVTHPIDVLWNLGTEKTTRSSRLLYMETSSGKNIQEAESYTAGQTESPQQETVGATNLPDDSQKISSIVDSHITVLISLPSVTLTKHANDPSPTRRPAKTKGPIRPGVQAKFFNLNSEADYLMVSVVPVLLATLLLVMIQVLTTSLNSMLPFMALGHPKGALQEDSLCLNPNPTVFSAPSIAFRFLRQFRNALPLLSTLLISAATILVTVSSEVIRLDVTTDCGNRTQIDPQLRKYFYPVRPCAYGLRQSINLMRLAQALLVVLGILVILIAVLLWRWKSGLGTAPWSIATMASMIKADGELHHLLQSIPAQSRSDTPQDMGTLIPQILHGRRFRLGTPFSIDTESPGHNTAYGIEVVPISKIDPIPIKPTTREPKERESVGRKKKRKTSWNISPVARERIIRIMALLFIIGLLILILCYEIIVGVHTGFEAFMNSQTIGVRIVFAGFGTTINAFWSYYFSYTCESQIHQLLARSPQPARTSILLSPPANVFVGLWRSANSAWANKRDLHDHMSFHLALAALLAKFTPIVLSNIPFSNAVTWKIHEVCTWLSVAFLAHMVLVLVASLLLPGPHSLARIPRQKPDKGKISAPPPAQPFKADSIAACLYYLCHSRMLKDFEGLATMGRKERNKLVSDMNKRYRLGVFDDHNGAGNSSRAGAAGLSEGQGSIRVDYV